MKIIYKFLLYSLDAREVVLCLYRKTKTKTNFDTCTERRRQESVQTPLLIIVNLLLHRVQKTQKKDRAQWMLYRLLQYIAHTDPSIRPWGIYILPPLPLFSTTTTLVCKTCTFDPCVRVCRWRRRLYRGVATRLLDGMMEYQGWLTLAIAPARCHKQRFVLLFSA